MYEWERVDTENSLWQQKNSPGGMNSGTIFFLDALFPEACGRIVLLPSCEAQCRFER